jgi:GcrA cell cycle regulator
MTTDQEVAELREQLRVLRAKLAASKVERDREIVARSRAGVSKRRLASDYGLTPERIGQILSRENGVPRASLRWPAGRDETLRALWRDGLSLSQIARQLAVSRNAVVGRAHRLDLPGRPSPIKRQPSPGSSGAELSRVTEPRHVELKRETVAFPAVLSLNRE